MTKTLERHGFLIFFISILMVTQLRWAEKINYDDIAQRLSVVILIGTLLNWGLEKWLNSFEEQTKSEKWQRRIKDISFTLSFSFLLVAFHQDAQLGGGIILLFIIYFLKSNDKARTWLSRSMNSKNFEVELDETKEQPMVLIKGNIFSLEALLMSKSSCTFLFFLSFSSKNISDKSTHRY